MNNTLEILLRTLIDKMDKITLIVTEIQSKQKKSNESIKSQVQIHQKSQQKIDLKQLRKIFNNYLITDIKLIQEEDLVSKTTPQETNKIDPQKYLNNWMIQNYDLIKEEQQMLELDQMLNNIQVAIAPTGMKFHTPQCNHISKSYQLVGLKQALKQKSHCIDCFKKSKVVIQNI